MTNSKSIAGGITWMVAAALLLLATFEPVSVSRAPAQAETAAITTVDRQAA